MKNLLIDIRREDGSRIYTKVQPGLNNRNHLWVIMIDTRGHRLDKDFGPIWSPTGEKELLFALKYADWAFSHWDAAVDDCCDLV